MGTKTNLRLVPSNLQQCWCRHEEFSWCHLSLCGQIKGEPAPYQNSELKKLLIETQKESHMLPAGGDSLNYHLTSAIKSKNVVNDWVRFPNILRRNWR